MADNERTFLQRPVPTDDSLGNMGTIDITSCKGLSRKNLIDSNYFEDCLNVDVDKLPIIMPLKVPGDVAFDPVWKRLNDAENNDQKIPIGENPSATAFGKWLVVGSYLTPDLVLTEDGWSKWVESMEKAGANKAVEFFGPGLQYKVQVGGAHPYTGMGAKLPFKVGGLDLVTIWHENSWLSWYCLVFIDIESKERKAYIALPPTAANDIAPEDKRWTEGDDDGTWAHLHEYMFSDPTLGERKLTAFQLYKQNAEYDVGQYETVLLTVNAKQLNEFFNEYGKVTFPTDENGNKTVAKLVKDSTKYNRQDLRKSLINSTDPENPSFGYYGDMAKRSILIPLFGAGRDLGLTTNSSGDVVYALDEWFLTEKIGDLFHAVSTPMPEDESEIENTFKGFVAQKKKPFGAFATLHSGGDLEYTDGDAPSAQRPPEKEGLWPIPFSLYADKLKNPERENYYAKIDGKLESGPVQKKEDADEGKPEYDEYDSAPEIEVIESASSYVEGALPAAAAIAMWSRQFVLYGDGVYISAWNNYADHTQHFGEDEELKSGDAWSSLSSGNATDAGSFVALCPYRNRMVCFKTGCTMEVRGQSSPFTLMTTSNVGAVGENAVCSSQGYLFFGGKDNIYMYTGSEPETVGDHLCLQGVTNAVMGADSKYMYCSVDTDRHENFIYSLNNGYWGRYDARGEAKQYLNTADGMYLLYPDRFGKMGMEWPKEWRFETKYFSGGTMNSLMLHSLNMILDMAPGSSLKISVRYYGDKDYTQIWYKKTRFSVEKEKVVYNWSGKKCAGFQLKLEGSGYSCIYAMYVTERTVRT